MRKCAHEVNSNRLPLAFGDDMSRIGNSRQCKRLRDRNRSNLLPLELGPILDSLASSLKHSQSRAGSLPRHFLLLDIRMMPNEGQ